MFLYTILFIAALMFFPLVRKFMLLILVFIFELAGANDDADDLCSPGNHYDNASDENHAYKENGGLYR